MIMKFKNTFFKTLRSAIFFIAIFLIAVPQELKAYDIGFQNWNNDDLSITWNKERAAFKFTMTVYDWDGADEWVSYIYILAVEVRILCVLIVGLQNQIVKLSIE